MILERRQAGPIPPVPPRRGFSSALRTLWPFVLPAGVVVVFFADLIFGDRAWFNAPSLFQFFPWKVDRAYSAADIINFDAIRQFIPYKAYLKTTWFGEGVFPLWNPFNLGGTPFFGSGLKSTLALTNFYYLFLDLATGLNAQIITQVFLSGVTMYFFAWKLTKDRVAASGAAVAYMLSGNLLTLSTFHGSVEEFLWTPLALLLAEKGIESGRLRAFAGMGLVMGLVFLSGMITVVPYLLLLIMGYAVFRIAASGGPPGANRASLFRKLGLALAIFLAFSAVKLLPLVSQFVASERVATVLSRQDLANMTGGFGDLAREVVKGLLGAAVPYQSMLHYRAGKGGAFYVGITVLLILIPMIPGIWRGRDSRGRFFLVATGGSLVVALTSGLFLRVVLEIADLDRIGGSLRSFLNYRWLQIYSAAIPLVFAYALSLLRTGKARGAALGWAAWAGGSLALVLAGFSLFSSEGPGGGITSLAFRFRLWIPAAAAALVSLSLTLHRRNLFGHTPLAAGILVLLFLELTAGHRLFYKAYPKEQLFPESRTTNFLRSRPGLFRVLTLPASGRFLRFYSVVATANLFLPYRIQDVSGYEALFPARQGAFFSRMAGSLARESDEPFHLLGMSHLALQRPALLDLLNVRYVIVSPDHPDLLEHRRFRLVFSEGTRIYENRRILPRAFVVRNALTVGREENILSRLFSGDFDPRKVILLENDPRGSVSTAASSFVVESKAKITKYSANSIEIDVQTAEPGFLFLSEAHHPGWKAWVDGKPARVRRANHMFRAVALEAGSHRVVMKFRPWTFTAGLTVSLITLSALGIAAIFSGRAARRRRT